MTTSFEEAPQCAICRMQLSWPGGSAYLESAYVDCVLVLAHPVCVASHRSTERHRSVRVADGLACAHCGLLFEVGNRSIPVGGGLFVHVGCQG